MQLTTLKPFDCVTLMAEPAVGRGLAVLFVFSMFKSFASARSAALVTGGLLAAGASQAVFTVPPEIAEAGTNAGLVGMAMFAVYVGIKAIKLLRRAL